MAMPDLFICHNNNAAELGADNLLDWQEVFTQEELSGYVSEFLEDGMVDVKLSVFPVSKSIHLLFISGTQFERFSAAAGITYDSLATWDGFFAAEEAYYTYSGGKPFCALDYPIRAVELNAMEQGKRIFTPPTAGMTWKMKRFGLPGSSLPKPLPRGISLFPISIPIRRL